MSNSNTPVPPLIPPTMFFNGGKVFGQLFIDQVGSVSPALLVNGDILATGTITGTFVQSGPFVITDTTPSTSTTTGALVVGGGVGIAGAAWLGTSLNLVAPTSTLGSLKVIAANNVGNTVTTVTTAPFGQTTTLTVPDPVNAAGKFLISPSTLVTGNVLKASGTLGLTVDAGFYVKAGKTAVYAGGSVSNVYVALGLTPSSIVTASNFSSTTAVSIVKAVPGTDTLTITWSSDPTGNAVVSYVAISGPV